MVDSADSDRFDEVCRVSPHAEAYLVSKKALAVSKEA